MATETIRRLYREVRKHLGECISPSIPYCYRTARTLAKWSALESLGLVRIIAEPDDLTPDYEGYDPDRDGPAEVTSGQYRLTDRHPWKTVDCVGGHVGYRDVTDWRENPYVIDHMAETIDQFRAAWKLHVRGICPRCLGTGRAPS